MTKVRALLLFPLGLLLLSGCGDNKTASAQLSGKVNYQGAPLKGGTLTLHFESAGAYAIGILPDGTYAARDLPTGEAKVTVETESINPSRKVQEYGAGKRPKGGQSPAPNAPGGGKQGAGGASPVPEGAGQTPKGEYTKIPIKYNNPNASGLTVTLVGGKQSHDFDLP